VPTLRLWPGQKGQGPCCGHKNGALGEEGSEFPMFGKKKCSQLLYNLLENPYQTGSTPPVWLGQKGQGPCCGQKNGALGEERFEFQMFGKKKCSQLLYNLLKNPYQTGSTPPVWLGQKGQGPCCGHKNGALGEEWFEFPMIGKKSAPSCSISCLRILIKRALLYKRHSSQLTRPCSLQAYTIDKTYALYYSLCFKL
jgi:hypothetical protein